MRKANLESRSTLRRHLLLAAVATVAICGLAGAPAGAQQRVPQQGDALDASNRVGSGGSNAPIRNPVNDRYRLGNNIVTGNVTGGQGFRGPVPYGSQRDFRDFTAGRFSSQFAGYSSGVSGGRLLNNAQNVRPYYGGSQVVQPPTDFARIPGTGGYVPRSVLEPLDARVDARANPVYTGQATARDTQLTLGLSGAALESGEYGGGLDRGRALSPYTQLARDARLEPFTPDTMRSLGSELLRDAQGNALTPEQLQGMFAREAEGSDQSAEDAALDAARPIDGAAPGGDAVGSLAGNMRQDLDEALRQRSELQLADPAQQSEQYAQLVERFRRFRERPGAEAMRPVGQAPETGGIVPAPPEQPAPEEGVEPPTTPTPQAQPEQRGTGLPSFLPPPRFAPPRSNGLLARPDLAVEIKSLAEGVSSPSLKRMYEQAEQLMAEGRFVSAIARFDVAERLVPNQPLTHLGRSMAELGAGYFRRSSASLRGALEQNPELMMARLDLPRFLGEERLAEVQETLVQRLTGEPQDPDAAFLLGFIAYHSGDRAAAADYLNTAQQRSGDAFFTEVSRYWGLTEAEPVPPGENPATQPVDQAEPE